MFFYCAATAWTFLSAAEPVRTWTSPDGRTLRARMLSSTGESVTLMTETGRTFILEFSKLSGEDVTYVKMKSGRAPRVDNSADGWLTRFGEAKERAAETKKPILLLFTGSDWCPPCKQLEKTVLSRPDFKTFAEKEVVLMKVDFPRNRKQKDSEKSANAELSKAYGVRGYPTLVLTDSDGKALSKFGYGGQDPDAFVDLVRAKLP